MYKQGFMGAQFTCHVKINEVLRKFFLINDNFSDRFTSQKQRQNSETFKKATHNKIGGFFSYVEDDSLFTAIELNLNKFRAGYDQI